MRVRFILPAVAIASAIACAGIGSAPAFAETAPDIETATTLSGFNDIYLYMCAAQSAGKEDYRRTILTQADLESITELNCNASSNIIADLTNLDKMINLNKIVLSAVTATNIDLSIFPNLTYVDVTNNWQNQSNPATVILPQNTGLAYLRLRGYDLQNKLDLTPYTSLKDLRLTHMKGISDLDVSHNTAVETLYVVESDIAELDTSNYTELKTLSISYDEKKDGNIDRIDVSKATKLTDLGLYRTKVSSLDLTNNLELDSLSVFYSELSSIDLSKNTKLVDVALSGNKLTELDVTNNPDLVILQIQINKIQRIDVSHNPKLINFMCDDIDVYSGIEASEDDANVYDLTPFKVLDFATGGYSVASSDQYTYDRSTKTLTVTDPDNFDGIVRINTSRTTDYVSSFDLVLGPVPSPLNPVDPDPESLPETDTTDETEPEAVPANPKTSDPIIVSILLGLAFGLAACLVSVKLTRRR